MSDAFETTRELLAAAVLDLCHEGDLELVPGRGGRVTPGDLIVGSIGFAGDDLRGAVTVAASASVWRSLAPDELGPEPSRELLCDAAGELCNLLVGRFRNLLLRRRVATVCGTPTMACGQMTGLHSPTAKQSEWHVFSCACGKVHVRLDLSFREGFTLPARDRDSLAPVTGDLLLF